MWPEYVLHIPLHGVIWLDCPACSNSFSLIAADRRGRESASKIVNVPFVPVGRDEGCNTAEILEPLLQLESI
jgi:hypothetical protein